MKHALTFATLSCALFACAHDEGARMGERVSSRGGGSTISIMTLSDGLSEGARTRDPRLPRSLSAHRSGSANDKVPSSAPSGARAGTLEWPVVGPVSSLYGMRDGRPHEGIDIAVPEGTPVRASKEGVVAYSGDRVRGYGKVVLVEHPDGLVTVYAHNSELLVKERDTVGRGQVIARSGQTGRASAPHVHFEVRERFRPMDPLLYLHGSARSDAAVSYSGRP